MPVKMSITKSECKVPIYIYTSDVESECINQAIALTRFLPIHKHLALMPDTHAGKGMPIGGVLPLIDAVSPWCVGVDIGCGMAAIKTSIKESDLSEEQHLAIRSSIRDKIPVGKNHRKSPAPAKIFSVAPFNYEIIKREWDSAQYQIGTLGGGNHFIEVQTDGEYIWVMIHSGSRNVGLQVANYYHAQAIKYGVAPTKELAYIPMSGPTEDLALDYLMSMQWCLDFALENRTIMMNDIIKIFKEVYGDMFKVTLTVNIHHNYAAIENHFGQNVVLHRKGATSARTGELGIIPGSMGSYSYIVRGLGNPMSFNSCSHGAGRVMSRTKAKENISVEDYKSAMSKMNLKVASDRDVYLDEAPQAYKDIDVVMENQNDLVEIVTKLKPYQLGAIKG